MPYKHVRLTDDALREINARARKLADLWKSRVGLAVGKMQGFHAVLENDGKKLAVRFANIHHQESSKGYDSHPWNIYMSRSRTSKFSADGSQLPMIIVCRWDDGMELWCDWDSYVVLDGESILNPIDVDSGRVSHPKRPGHSGIRCNFPREVFHEMDEIPSALFS